MRDACESHYESLANRMRRYGMPSIPTKNIVSTQKSKGQRRRLVVDPRGVGR
jgi:hypothetical protein